MGKVIGIDYGTKRIGIAISDELKMIASPLEFIHAAELIDYLKKKVNENSIDAFVLGLPRDLSGRETNATHQVLDLEKHLKKTFPEQEIHLIDERFTSKMASQAMITGNVPKNKRREKGMIDKISAAIILQSFLDQRPR